MTAAETVRKVVNMFYTHNLPVVGDEIMIVFEILPSGRRSWKRFRIETISEYDESGNIIFELSQTKRNPIHYLLTYKVQEERWYVEDKCFHVFWGEDIKPKKDFID